MTKLKLFLLQVAVVTCSLLLLPFSYAGPLDLKLVDPKVDYNAVIMTFTGRKEKLPQQLIPGLWELGADTYDVRVYMADTKRDVDENGLPFADPDYQIITDIITITDTQSAAIPRTYALPKDRGLYESSWAVAFSGGMATLPDEFEVPNVKYSIAGGANNSLNSFPETQSFVSSPYSESQYTDMNIYIHRQFADSIFLFELGAGLYNNSTALEYNHGGAGIGVGGSIGSVRVWIAGGAEVLNGALNQATVITADGQIEVDGTYSTVAPYVRLGFTPKNGGLIGTLKYNTEGVISFNLGWNFGGTKAQYEILESTTTHQQ